MRQVVRHTPWTWSPDLALYFTHRFGDDDEVIEAIWLQFSDLKERTHTEDKISREASKGKM
jgi:hypothetical protein